MSLGRDYQFGVGVSVWSTTDTFTLLADYGIGANTCLPDTLKIILTKNICVKYLNLIQNLAQVIKLVTLADVYSIASLSASVCENSCRFHVCGNAR